VLAELVADRGLEIEQGMERHRVAGRTLAVRPTRTRPSSIAIHTHGFWRTRPTSAITVNAKLPRRFPSAQTLDLNRVTNPPIKLHHLHPPPSAITPKGYLLP
jgi:hypothetical protein